MDDEQFANCEHGQDCCGNCLREDCQLDVTSSMVLFMLLERIVAKQRAEGTARAALREGMVRTSARTGNEEFTRTVFDMLWPKENS